MHTNEVGKTYTRPWGNYRTLELGDGFQVKSITVNPHGRLSLQKHNKRAERWIVVHGQPTITVGDDIKTYKNGDVIIIPVDTAHRMENLTDTLVMIIEVQLGSYLGEDDIIRLDDVYGRV
jgi:mannose-6-phosphate isomerase-like protein (cupin superfamily)